MNIYNIVEVPQGREKALAPEIVRQQKAIGSRDFAFLLTMEPEQPPYAAKLEARLEAFARLAPFLRQEGIRCGILIQSLLCHGERGQPRSPAPFQRMVNADGSLLGTVFCPLDPGFQHYVADGIRRIATAAPDFILTDDDVRLVHGAAVSKGCFCPLHLDLFRQRSGRAFSREALLETAACTGPEAEAIRRHWHESEEESLLQLGRVIRTAVDEINPSLRAGVCVNPSLILLNDRLSRTMAGKNRPFIRLAGACYQESDNKRFPYRIDFILRQRRLLPETTEVLLEADTFPQHRFSTSATTLKAHVATAALLGLESAKCWIEPIPAEPFGKNEAYVSAYRTLRPWLDAVRPFSGKIEWHGAAACLKNNELYRLPWSAQNGKQLIEARWVSVLGRLGIPQIPGGSSSARLRCFDGPSVEGYDREEWLGFLQEGVLLDGDAAERLCRMGLAEHLGVNVETDGALYLSGEHYHPLPQWNGETSGLIRSASKPTASAVRRLTPLSGQTIAPGEYISRPWRQSPETTRVAPSLTLFQNGLGGRVAVYAADLASTAFFHFITPYRREQLVRVLRWLAPDEYPLELEVRTECDLYVLQGSLPGEAGQLLYFLNLQPDPFPHLVLERPLPASTRIEALNLSGQWEAIPWRIVEGRTMVDRSLTYLENVLLRVLPGEDEERQ